MAVQLCARHHKQLTSLEPRRGLGTRIFFVLILRARFLDEVFCSKIQHDIYFLNQNANPTSKRREYSRFTAEIVRKNLWGLKTDMKMRLIRSLCSRHAEICTVYTYSICDIRSFECFYLGRIVLFVKKITNFCSNYLNSHLGSA